MEKVQIQSKQVLSQRILKEGNKIRHNDVTLFYAPQTQANEALIIASVAKKVSKLATQRNRLRRQLKGLLQHHAKEILPKYYWMWICKTADLSKETQQLFITDLEKLNVS